MKKLAIFALIVLTLITSNLLTPVKHGKLDITSIQAVEYECQMTLAEVGEMQPEDIIEICQY